MQMKKTSILFLLVFTITSCKVANQESASKGISTIGEKTNESFKGFFDDSAKELELILPDNHEINSIESISFETLSGTIKTSDMKFEDSKVVISIGDNQDATHPPKLNFEFTNDLSQNCKTLTPTNTYMSQNGSGILCKFSDDTEEPESATKEPTPADPSTAVEFKPSDLSEYTGFPLPPQDPKNEINPDDYCQSFDNINTDGVYPEGYYKYCED